MINNRPDPPVMDELISVVQAQNGIRISNVYNQKHTPTPCNEALR
jgi:hypothetical protein